jgi:hypothetical protein
MPKLLSKKEVETFAAKMTGEYGLPPPRIIVDESRGYDSGLKVEIVRDVTSAERQFLWAKKLTMIKIRDFYVENFEDLLTKLQYELSRFDNRAKIAEQFREKYAQQEASEVLDKVLSDK